MDKSSRTLTKWRDESGTPGSTGDYQHKVTFYCTCIGHAFGAKIFDAGVIGTEISVKISA
jgi:hypothetical protein